ncbi:MAG TPA: glycosyltransferase, partial [Solirubrobacteraceae bacterium]|nr:glycosyltransferase [Solirubrobacteraceae bacterium]
MPLLTLVLAVHREQGHLEELLASLEGQDLADAEVVAIDDASPDHAPELLDALARRDPRVRVRHLAERSGLAAARNLGLELARGDHVWFVQATGLLAPGAVAAVAGRLRAGPDVLVVGHRRVDRLRREHQGPALGREPALGAVGRRVWDKVLRREHLRALGVRFAPGLSGELPVTWPALLAASSIAALPGTAYVHREPGNAVREGSPFDVFAQYDAVFAFVDAHPSVPDARRRLILPAMVDHELRLLARLPEAERPAFFERMAAAHARHRRGDEPLPGERVARLRTRLVARGDHRAYRALESALAARRAAAHPRAALARRWRHARRRPTELQRHYRARLAQPIDPDLAVFAAYWYRGYSCNPRAIYEKARELVPSLRGVWIVREDAADRMPAGVEHVVSGTP